ncbi:MAG: ABC transporter permease [Acidimicrobiales bacterium]
MKRLTYIRYEVLRTLRNRRFLIFSLIFPLVLFLAIAGEHRHAVIEGIGFPLYFMTGMAAWGSMTAVVSIGGRIAQERSVGWTRQMRITPLKTSTYFTAKILTSYMTALFSIVVLALAGTLLGVRLDAVQWLTMLGLLLIGLIPFVVLGIMLGHLISVDSLGPALGGITSLMALLGGAFGPLFTSGVLLKIVKILPSYWLVQAGKSALLGVHVWSSEAWIVLAAWTLVLTRITVRVYRRDTSRV